MRKLRAKPTLVPIVLSLVVSGCFADVPVIAVDHWDLEVEGQRASVHLPAHLGFGLEEHDATYRLRTTVPLPQTWRGQDVTLGIPLLPAHVELLVDGIAVAALDDHVFDRGRTVMPHRFRIDRGRTNREALALELIVENDWVQGSWIDTVPTLSSGAYGDRWTRTVRAFNVLSCEISLIASFTLVLVFAMRYLLARFRRGQGVDDAGKNAVFARLVGAATLFPAAQLGLFQPLIGRRDIAILMMAVLFAITASVELARRYLGLGPRAAWVWILVGGSSTALFIAAGSFLNPIVASLVVLIFVGFVVYLVALAVRHWREPGAAELRWIAVGWGVTLAVCSIDLVTVLGQGAPLRGILLAPTAIWLFSALVGIRLGRVHRLLLEQEVKLGNELKRKLAQLEERNREVGQLNTELQRKVGDRSRELAAALRRIHDHGGQRTFVDDVLADRYRVVRELGSGAMGQVFEVERLADGRPLAAKVLRGQISADALARFTQEAELAARIDHPNVVRMVDVDVTRDGELFLVMELVDGQSLDQTRSRFGERGFALTVLSQLARALATIHARGVIHRDLKPANVLVARGPAIAIKLADFGIAGSRDAPSVPSPIALDATLDAGSGATVDTTSGDTARALDTPRLTRAGVVMGTPLYMAPEAWSGGHKVAAPADVFAFGLIAYELLGGTGLERRVPGGPVDGLTRFETLVADLPAALVAALQRALAEAPSARPTAEALAALLAPYASAG